MTGPRIKGSDTDKENSCAYTAHCNTAQHYCSPPEPRKQKCFQLSIASILFIISIIGTNIFINTYISQCNCHYLANIFENKTCWKSPVNFCHWCNKSNKWIFQNVGICYFWSVYLFYSFLIYDVSNMVSNMLHVKHTWLQHHLPLGIPTNSAGWSHTGGWGNNWK